jgi:hypothetical protein
MLGNDPPRDRWTRVQVRSIQVDDGEISVRIERPGGGGRVVVYPITILADKSTVR